MDLTAAILWPHRRFQKIRESLATPDSYEGRASAYRGLADADERKAHALRGGI